MKILRVTVLLDGEPHEYDIDGIEAGAVLEHIDVIDTAQRGRTAIVTSWHLATTPDHRVVLE